MATYYTTPRPPAPPARGIIGELVWTAEVDVGAT